MVSRVPELGPLLNPFFGGRALWPRIALGEWAWYHIGDDVFTKNETQHVRPKMSHAKGF